MHVIASYSATGKNRWKEMWESPTIRVESSTSLFTKCSASSPDMLKRFSAYLGNQGYLPFKVLGCIKYLFITVTALAD